MGLIIELEKELTSQNCDIISCLRKCKIISRKLGQRELSKWVDLELGGYSKADIIPVYRKDIKGQLKYFNPFHGWQTIYFDSTDLENSYTMLDVREAIPKLVELCSDTKNTMFMHPINGEVLAFLWKDKDFGPYDTSVVFDRSIFVDIIEKVKNQLLEWMLLLEEEGITGDGYIFSQEEKDLVDNNKDFQNLVVNIYGAGNNLNISSTIQDSHQVIDNSKSINYEELNKLIEKCIGVTDSELFKIEFSESSQEIKDQLEHIKQMLMTEEDPIKTKSKLEKLKNTVANIGQGVVASGIYVLLEKAFNCF